MWKILIVIAIVYMITIEVVSKPYQARLQNGYETQNFQISNGKSMDIYNELMWQNKWHKLDKRQNSDEVLAKFATMEDKFLEYEKDAVCRNIDTKYNAIQLSQQIKESFPGYNFDYHDIHIKQISEPNKLINRNLKCF